MKNAPAVCGGEIDGSFGISFGGQWFKVEPGFINP
jgi:hypothetical protein